MIAYLIEIKSQDDFKVLMERPIYIERRQELIEYPMGVKRFGPNHHCVGSCWELVPFAGVAIEDKSGHDVAMIKTLWGHHEFMADYGVRWRAWTDKPMPEQMALMPWRDVNRSKWRKPTDQELDSNPWIMR